MITYKGKSVYKGIAMGQVTVIKDRKPQVKRYRIEDVDSEIARADRAGRAAKKQLQRLYDRAVKEVGEKNAAIFEVHQMLLEDKAYFE